jgi:hypothetical protein
MWKTEYEETQLIEKRLLSRGGYNEGHYFLSNVGITEQQATI